ncbi:hypothetical protein GW17_00045233 [Ensete ventricosum]|nr:hypothetical protein GW17_00045233 [Ensete ventricosum]
MRTAHYRAVSLKIDRRRPIEGKIDRQRSIEGEKGKKKKRKRRKKEKRSIYFPAPSSSARHRCPWVASAHGSHAPFLPREEKGRGDNAKCFAQKELNFTPTWSKSLIVLVASGIVSSSPLSLSLAPLSRKVPGLYPLALSWYLEFASAFFTFLAPFTTNALLSLHESKGSMRKSRLCGTIVLLSPWHYYPLPRICISFFAIGRSASMVLWHSSKFTSILIDA